MLPIQKVPTWRTLCSTATGRVNACLTRDHRSFVQTPQSCKHRPLLLQKERRNQKMISGSTNLSLDIPLQEYLWPGLYDSAFNYIIDFPTLYDTDVFALSLELYSTSPKDQKWGLTTYRIYLYLYSFPIYHRIMKMTKWESWGNMLKGKTALQILWAIKLSNV